MTGNELITFFQGLVYDETGPFEIYAWQRDESGMTRVFCGPQDEGQSGGWAVLWIECPDAVVWEGGGNTAVGYRRKKVDKGRKREEGKKE